MAQVQNDLLYIRYRSSSRKNKAEECKKLTDYIPVLFYCQIYSINSANLAQGRENHPKNFQLCSSSFLLSSSSSSSSSSSLPLCITKKLYGVYEYYTYQMTTLLMEIFLFLFGVVCELRLASYSLETVLKVQNVLI